MCLLYGVSLTDKEKTQHDVIVNDLLYSEGVLSYLRVSTIKLFNRHYDYEFQRHESLYDFISGVYGMFYNHERLSYNVKRCVYQTLKDSLRDELKD